MGFIVRLFKRIVFFLLLSVIIIFAVSNDHTSILYFWPLEQGISIPVYTPVIFSLFGGIIVGGIFVSFQLYRTKFKLHRANRTIKKQLETIDKLENTLTLDDKNSRVRPSSHKQIGQSHPDQHAEQK